jgi:hypothetical protein
VRVDDVARVNVGRQEGDSRGMVVFFLYM